MEGEQSEVIADAVEVAQETHAVANAITDAVEGVRDDADALAAATERAQRAEAFAADLAAAQLMTDLGRRIGELENQCQQEREVVRGLMESSTILTTSLAELSTQVTTMATGLSLSSQSPLPVKQSSTPAPSPEPLVEPGAIAEPAPEPPPVEPPAPKRRRIVRL